MTKAEKTRRIDSLMEAFSEGTITKDQFRAALDKLNGKDGNGKQRNVYFKVSEKGAISVYGIWSRTPVTLYVEGWEIVKQQIGEIMEFAADNADQLATKDGNPYVPPKGNGGLRQTVNRLAGK